MRTDLRGILRLPASAAEAQNQHGGDQGCGDDVLPSCLRAAIARDCCSTLPAGIGRAPHLPDSHRQPWGGSLVDHDCRRASVRVYVIGYLFHTTNDPPAERGCAERSADRGEAVHGFENSASVCRNFRPKFGTPLVATR